MYTYICIDCVHVLYTMYNVHCIASYTLKCCYVYTLIVRGRKAKKSSNREKIGNKPIPSPMCPKWCPITPLRMVRCTAGCNMVISGWVWSIVGKYLTSFRKELGRPEKSITDQNHDISGGRVQKYRCDR